MARADITPIALTLVETDLAAAARAFGDAFGRTGFAVVANHGIDTGVIDRALAAAKAVFALPDAVKARYHQPGGGGQRGLTPFGVETAKGAKASDLKEFWHVGRDLAPGDPLRAAMPDNVWPDEVADFRPAVTALYAALDAAGARILRAIAVHLGLDAGFFDGPTAGGNSILRLLHYPPVTGPTAAARAGAHEEMPLRASAHGDIPLRASAHEDINVITLLLGADEAGLQLLGRDGEWRDIEAPPGTLVCNIGDMLQRLTNHRLPSTTHRVVNPAADRATVARFSTPFFLHFRPDYEIVTLPSCVDPEHPDRFPHPITADAYLRERLREIGLL